MPFMNVFLFSSLSFSEKDEMLNSNKPHCHPRLPKPNLNILLIQRDILGKQLFQATSCYNNGRQIASWKVSNLFYRIMYDGQNNQVLT